MTPNMFKILKIEVVSPKFGVVFFFPISKMNPLMGDPFFPHPSS